jgi:hypothetical protein
MDTALHLAMRWLHVASVVVLLGGVFYARVVMGDMAKEFRPVVYAAIGGILLSGLYNFLSKTSFPPHYHAWFGIKVLLALHVFAATILYREGKRRSLTGVIVSGALILSISAYLRWISLK